MKTKVNANDFRPDWNAIWTGQEAESQLNGFRFAGPGWYVTASETLLVIPAQEVEDPFAQRWPDDTKFFFHCFDRRNPASAFNSIINAPRILLYLD